MKLRRRPEGEKLQALIKEIRHRRNAFKCRLAFGLLFQLY